MTEPVGEVLAHRAGAILILTLRNPPVRNALDAPMAQELGRLLEEAQNDTDVHAVILTGDGDRAFCAGANLRVVARGGQITPDVKPYAGWGFGGVTRHVLDVPLIAAVNGAALGGGLELVLACDIIIAAEHAVFGLPEVRHGLIAAEGGAFRLPQRVPHAVAMEMILTGDPITAARAHQIGLVNEVVADGLTVAAAVATAQRIAHGTASAVRASKRIALGITDGAIQAEQGRWRLSDAEFGHVQHDSETARRTTAFVAKPSSSVIE